VSSNDPNVAKVELVARALGDLAEQLVFVGGCACGLLISDPAAPSPRVTFDVDLLAEVAALAGYHKLERKFEKLGFRRDMTKDAPICRWRYGDIEVDLMPTDAKVLGFANRWYPAALATAISVTLPSGARIRLIDAPAFVATKFEAFRDRGRGDFFSSHDLEDLICVVDGRPELVDEIAHAESGLRHYLADTIGRMLSDEAFLNALPGLVLEGSPPQGRVPIVLQRLTAISNMNAKTAP
jgi:predicted nucleotidyltransferase